MLIKTANQYNWEGALSSGNEDIDGFKQDWGRAKVKNLCDLRQETRTNEKSIVLSELRSVLRPVKVHAGEPALRATLECVQRLGGVTPLRIAGSPSSPFRVGPASTHLSVSHWFAADACRAYNHPRR